MEGTEREVPIFRDIRRYYCEYCGICRSKKSLITSHVLSRHKDVVEEKRLDENEGEVEEKSNICEECGASFKKPAYLKQHMQSHSLERPFTCPVDDCQSSYRRKDHLTRHLLQHQGKLFNCPVENCTRRFAFQGNMKRHVNEIHEEDGSSSCNTGGQKKHVCKECGKVFEFASKLRKHEDSHVKLDTVEVVCGEPGCMKHFTNDECLKAHVQSCHQHVTCEVCGQKHLKKNIKRHLRMHEAGVSSSDIKCSFKGCRHTFTTKSNLNQHIKSTHLEVRPFACRIRGCDKKFPYRHVRDNHEKSGIHIYVHGDFEESDELFRSRPRGGRKRACPSVETLLRKRVTPPSQMDSVTNQGPEYIAWLLSELDDQP
ncbi:transcription factor IIIA-like [Telopea speciosissima]|uniref:transcription factor IIIA-like n=1 Tax=Telopea speciosissima TaxID=54955 RepID=UPI001CC533AB|nr:transcription factor IIIA-like [Telopea speciosissima]